jgi:hypothetical protein
MNIGSLYLPCSVCGQEPSFWIFDSCKSCSAAYICAHPGPWAGNRRFYTGTVECAELDREIARQTEALTHLARAVG